MAVGRLRYEGERYGPQVFGRQEYQAFVDKQNTVWRYLFSLRLVQHGQACWGEGRRSHNERAPAASLDQVLECSANCPLAVAVELHADAICNI